MQNHVFRAPQICEVLAFYAYVNFRSKAVAYSAGIDYSLEQLNAHVLAARALERHILRPRLCNADTICGKFQYSYTRPPAPVRRLSGIKRWLTVSSAHL